MVTSVTSKEVSAILNGTTSKVAELKKKFTLGALGYNLHKLFSFLFSNLNPTKKAIQNAECIDKMPTKIKQTAAKISQLIGKGDIVPLVLDDRAERLVPVTETCKVNHVSLKNEKSTNELQKLMDTLAEQSRLLREAHGHDVKSASAYIEALKPLITTEEIDLSGQNYLVLSTITKYAQAFATKPSYVIIKELDAFIQDMETAFPDAQEGFVKTHIYRELSQILTETRIDASIEQITEEKAKEKAKSMNTSLQEQIDAILKDFDIKKTEIYSLRGPNGNDGMIHNAWIGYMLSSCKFTLEADRLTTNEKGKLTQEERDLLTKYVAYPDTLEKELNCQEARLTEIFARDGFNKISLDASKEIPAEILHVNINLLKLKKEREKAFENYQILDARLKDLVGGAKEPEIKVEVIGAGDYKIEASMDAETKAKIEPLVQQMKEKEDKIVLEYKTDTEFAVKLKDKLAYARDNFFPSYLPKKEDNFPFADAALALS